MTAPLTDTAARHPYDAGRSPRRLYLLAQGLLVVATAVLMVAYGALFQLRPDAAMALAAVSAVLWVVARLLRQRSWWSVAWRDQDGTAEPAWVTTISRGTQLALFIALFAYAMVLGTLWAAVLAIALSWALAGVFTVRAVRGFRTDLAARWRAWRVVDAAGFSLTACAVVAALAVQTHTTAAGLAGLVVGAVLAAAMGACAAFLAHT